MFNFRLEIAYDGTSYCGWQAQNSSKKKSIQEVIERTLQKIFQEKIKLIASGRTDAGVHAKAQVANFKASKEIPLKKLQKALNGLLPEDIKVAGVKREPPGFHSRFDTKSKLYRYTILNRSYPCVFSRNSAYFCPFHLDIKLMKKELVSLLGRHDFSAFRAHDKKERDSVRTIKKASIVKSKDLIHIDIEADGFLYNMVRNIAGTLIEIGRGKLGKGSLKKVLLSCDRRRAGPTAEARGLCLVKVKY